jgi:hypothetical protein
MAINWGVVGLLSATVVAGVVGFTLANHSKLNEVVLFGPDGRVPDAALLERLGPRYVPAPRAAEADLHVYVVRQWRELDPISRSICEPGCAIGSPTDAVEFTARGAPFRGRRYVFLRYSKLSPAVRPSPCVHDALALLIQGEERNVDWLCGVSTQSLNVQRQEAFSLQLE